MIYPDGSYYTSYLKDNQRFGQGKLMRSDETSYESMWESDQVNGIGILVHADGDIY